MSKISIDKTMEDIVSIQNQINGLTMLLNNKKSIMAKYFEKSGNRQVANDECTCYVQERTKIEYDVDAILENVDEELVKKFIDKEYKIIDHVGLFKFLKSKGIQPKELRHFLFVDKKVNEKKLNDLYEKEQISLSDLEGCYNAHVVKTVVIRMKNIDKEIPIEK